VSCIVQDMKHSQSSNPTLRALAALDLFSSCDDVQLALLLPHADIVDVSAGDVVDRAGRSARQFVGILDGYVRRLDQDGGASVIGRGQHFGAAELMQRADHRATYVTVTATQLLVVFGPAFRAAVRQMPDVAELAIDEVAAVPVHELSPVG
jgi:CRP-like cAMP-binding protein